LYLRPSLPVNGGRQRTAWRTESFLGSAAMDASDLGYVPQHLQPALRVLMSGRPQHGVPWSAGGKKWSTGFRRRAARACPSAEIWVVRTAVDNSSEISGHHEARHASRAGRSLGAGIAASRDAVSLCVRGIPLVSAVGCRETPREDMRRHDELCAMPPTNFIFVSFWPPTPY